MKRWAGLFVGAVAVFSNGCSKNVFTVPDPGIVANAEDAELVARGGYLVNGAAHCSGCHVPVEQGVAIKRGDTPAPIGNHAWAMGPIGTLRSSNITASKEFGVGAWSDAELARVIKYGVTRDGTIAPFMRIAMGTIADDDVKAIVSYLRTVAPVESKVPPEEVGLLGHMVLGGLKPRENTLTTAPPLSATVERGKYLAWGPANCVGCHSEADGFDLKPGREFVGAGEPMPSEIDDDKNQYRAPNLTPHPTGIAGQWTEEQFLARFKEGRVHKGSPMPWGNYENLQEDDVKALWMYLKTLAPVPNDTSITVIPKG